MSNDNDDFSSMLCLDIYLSSLSGAAYKKVAQNIKSKPVFPIISWDVSGNYLQKNHNSLQETDRQYLEKLSKKFRWKLDINTIMPHYYEALVVTNVKQEIYWVNEGFVTMTGYSEEHALGKKPNFLQGKNTPENVRRDIREHLIANKPYAGTIVNYRKNQEEYVCNVKIIPIMNDKDKVTHFIAFEREAV